MSALHNLFFLPDFSRLPMFYRSAWLLALAATTGLLSGCGMNAVVASTNHAAVSTSAPPPPSPSPTPSPAPPPSNTNSLPPGNWQLVFDDEFDGPSLDPTLWRAENNQVCGSWQSCSSSRWADNVTVSNGQLHLVAMQQERLPGLPWTTGGIYTRQFTQQYGYFEARIRYAAASGLNNAFWLNFAQLSDSEQTPFEIDINEGHFSTELNLAFHNWTNDNNDEVSKAISEPQDLSADFHIYGLQWTAAEIIWYFDGVEVWRTANTTGNAPAQMLLSTTVMDWAGPAEAGLNGKSMDVDWVHVYQSQN